MSIVSSNVVRDGPHVVERHADHLGHEYVQTWFAPADWTTAQVDAKVAEHAAQIEASLADGEFQALTQ